VLVDDSHATGVLGPNGKGTPEHFGVADRVDILTSTLGKALGGGAGGFTSGRREIIALLRQRSRPYLFSNALPPVITAAALKALEIVIEGEDLRATLKKHAQMFRSHLEALGFQIVPGQHPIIPVMLGDAELATRMAERLLEEGIYVIGFSFPVVPKGKARIRVQMSAAHTREQLERAIPGVRKGWAGAGCHSIDGQTFTALNGGPVFTFNEAISFQVNCETQEEVDYYWEKLSEGGDEKAQQCGWLKDKYGISWQIIPKLLSELVGDPDSEKSQKAMQAMLQMKKIDIETIKRAYGGPSTT
jgi:predicted 3-demethylubiquinone-9 3-methyltransferase (glyoxalase superfamily)